MPEFLELFPPQVALQQVFDHISSTVQSETIETISALGRVTAEDIIAGQPLPAFSRSTVDGYAVRASDTYGSSEALPAYLSVAGEIPMGSVARTILGAGQCALIHTGGMLPSGADAVVMVEHTQQARLMEIEVLRAVAVGENVLHIGEDVASGEVVIPTGTRLRPAEIGGLMALGKTQIMVKRRPHVGIISSGDEVIDPEREPELGQVRDVNSFSLAALVEAAGGIALRFGIAPDQFDALDQIAREALQSCDIVVITAGSSASARDLTSRVIAGLGDPGVLVHGVEVRPGKPTILAVCNGKAVIGLPGNPVSALVIARLFVIPLLEAYQDIRNKRPIPTLSAELTLNLASQAGREDWVAVRLVQSGNGYLAEPVFGKSNLIFTLVRSDGLLRIPPDATGLEAGQMVEVHLL